MEEEIKVSTPKQFAVALVNISVRNTTVLLVKPDFRASYRSASIPSILGISTFYASQYVTVAGEQQITMFDCLGQNVPAHSFMPCIINDYSNGEGGHQLHSVTVTLSSDGNDVCMQSKEGNEAIQKEMSECESVRGALCREAA